MSTPSVDYYRLLEVDPAASLDVIERAFTVIAKRHHPDLNGGSAASTRVMQQLNEAMEVLRSPKQRAEYDRARGLLSGPPPSAAHTGTSSPPSSVPAPPGSADFSWDLGPQGTAPVSGATHSKKPMSKGLKTVLIIVVSVLVLGCATNQLWSALQGPGVETSSDSAPATVPEPEKEPQVQPFMEWVGALEPANYIPAENADTAPEPAIATPDFHEAIRSGKAFYLFADVDPATGDWAALAPALERGFELFTVRNDVIVGEAPGSLDVTYSYEGISLAGEGGGNYSGRVIAVYQALPSPDAPPTDSPTWTAVLLTLD